MKTQTILLLAAVGALAYVVVQRELDAAKQSAFGGLGFLKEINLGALKNIFGGGDRPTFDEWTEQEYGTKVGDPDDWKILE